MFLFFQSTLLQEERQICLLYFLTNGHLSIHAPTRGATHFSSFRCAKINLSIHAPTRGATIPQPWDRINRKLSIHAPTRGATLCQDKIATLQALSIHAPTRGATTCSRGTLLNMYFQSTLLQEERLLSSFYY